MVIFVCIHYPAVAWKDIFSLNLPTCVVSGQLWLHPTDGASQPKYIFEALIQKRDFRKQDKNLPDDALAETQSSLIGLI